MALRRTDATGGTSGSRPPSAAEIRRAVAGSGDGHMLAIDTRGATLAETVLSTDDPELIVREVSSLWSQAQRTFLTIGRYLLQARGGIERRLTAGAMNLSESAQRVQAQREYKLLILDRLPFGPKVAHQLESVARAVFETRRISLGDLPWSYSVAYQLTTLSADEFEAARSEGLVGPAARREAVIEFKRRRRAAVAERVAELRGRKARLLAAMQRLQQELDAIVSELGEEDDRRAIDGDSEHDPPPSKATGVAT